MEENMSMKSKAVEENIPTHPDTISKSAPINALTLSSENIEENDATEENESAEDTDEETDRNSKLFIAIRKGDIHNVITLLNEGVRDRNYKGNTPLHYGVEWRQCEIVEKLLTNYRADIDINARNDNGDSPLHIAVRKGYTELVTLLLNGKSDIGLQNKDDESPLDIAKKSNKSSKQEIVQILELHIQLDQQNLQMNQKPIQNNFHAHTLDKPEQQNCEMQNINQSQENLVYSRRGGTTGGLKGNLYEICLLILGKLRGEIHTNKFYLGTNIGGLGAFDDLVMKYWNNCDGKEKSTTIFLQSKHIEKYSISSIENFINEKNDKFYLGKYFLDYLNVREKFSENSNNPEYLKGTFSDQELKFIIYTNAVLDEKFDASRIFDIENNNIFFTKSIKSNQKGFKFKFDDKNFDLIDMLENIVFGERIELLAKALVSFIFGKKVMYHGNRKFNVRYSNMMSVRWFSVYHVFLAQNVIEVEEEIRKDEKNNSYREGKISEKFLNINKRDNKILYELKEKVLNESAKYVIFNSKKVSLELDTAESRIALVKEMAYWIKGGFSKEIDIDVIKKLSATFIVLNLVKNTKEIVLKFIPLHKAKNESVKQFIAELEYEIGNKIDTLDIPYESIKNALVEHIKSQPLKLDINFGNINPTFKKRKHLSNQLFRLFVHNENNKFIEINDKICQDIKLGDGDVKNIGKLVGNLLVFDQEKKIFKFAGRDDLKGEIQSLLEDLEELNKLNQLDLSGFEFNINVKEFPRLILSICDEDSRNVKEFLNKLEILSGQADSNEIENIIKEEIKSIYELLPSEVESNFLRIKKKAEIYWLTDEAKLLTKGDGLFNNILKCGIKFNVRDPIDLFIGRKKELEELHNNIQNDMIRVDKVRRMICITGLGGIGKSELVRKYVSAYSDNYDGNIIWINANSYQSMTESFRRLARDELEIDIRKQGEGGMDIKTIIEKVYRFFEKRKNLFIFDNAKKYHSQEEGDGGLHPFWLSQFSGVNKPYVLITSRGQEWGSVKDLSLDVFNNGEAIELVRIALEIKNGSQEEQVQELIDTLQSYPLALKQAVTFIKLTDNEVKKLNPQNKYTIQDYLKEYHMKTEELFNVSFPDINDKYAKITYATWLVTIDNIKIQVHGENALIILDFIAYCTPDNIPIEMLSRVVQDHEEFKPTILLLKQYSLVNIEGETLSVDRLVQQVTRLQINSQNEQETIFEKLLKLLFQLNIEELNLINYQSLLEDINNAIPIFNQIPLQKICEILKDPLCKNYDLKKELLALLLSVIPSNQVANESIFESGLSRWGIARAHLPTPILTAIAHVGAPIVTTIAHLHPPIGTSIAHLINLHTRFFNRRGD